MIGNEEITDDNSFDFLSTVKTLLGIHDDAKDKILQIYIDMTKEEIMNYCNISEFPIPLSYPLCNIVVDLYRENTSKNDVGNIVGNVSSVSEDGRTVAFSTHTEQLDSSIKTKVLGISQINRFRKLYRL